MSFSRIEAIHEAAEINRQAPEQFRKVKVRPDADSSGYVIHCIDQDNKLWILRSHGDAFKVQFQKAG